LKLNLIKKVFNFLFKKQSKTFRDRILCEINNKNWVAVILNDKIKIRTKNNLTVDLRDIPSSDLYVFNQIFLKEEYKFTIDIYKKYFVDIEDLVLIDAGANIGLTSLYLDLFFNFSKIITIEPSLENIEILKLNCNKLIKNSSIKFRNYNKVLHNKSGVNHILKTDFRDGNDWALRSEKDESGNISSIALDKIITENNLDYISILKIDIEGAERFLFREGNDYDFLEITKLIAIEIHDEFNIRSIIIDTLKSYNFLIFEEGETTVAINKNLSYDKN